MSREVDAAVGHVSFQGSDEGVLRAALGELDSVL